MDFVPLKNKSDYSYLRSISRPYQIAQRIREAGYKGGALVDTCSLAGSVKIEKAFGEACKHCGYTKDRHAENGEILLENVECKGYEKDPLRTIIGEDFNVCAEKASIREQTNRSLSTITLLAKNKQGWTNLARACSWANTPEHFYYKPRIQFDELANIAKTDTILITGCPGSDLANLIFASPTMAYKASSYEEARSYAKDWKVASKEIIGLVNGYSDLWGKDNVFLEVNLLGAPTFPAQQIVSKSMRWLAKEVGIRPIAVNHSFYPKKEDAVDQKIVICAGLGITLEEAKVKVGNLGNFEYDNFFKAECSHIPSYDELKDIHTVEELTNTVRVLEMCENYVVTSKPKIPKFDCPDGLSPEDYLLQLCREGWKEKLPHITNPELRNTYSERVKKELGVLSPIGLSPYFLIIHDICRYAQKELNCLPSPGRGSAAGCLISYLLGLTDCDAVEYNLSFERFYNAGRNTADNISLPDIDCDFPITKREQIKDYVFNKFGLANTAQIATFGRLKGRSVIKEILRANKWGSFQDRNLVVKPILDDAAISDQLQEMSEESGEASAILWALEHHADDMKDYCKLNEDGSLEGPLAKFFEQGIRLEGVKRSQGKHAAGIIISNEPLADFFPMLYDKSGDGLACGMEHTDCESCGLVKIDVLGVAVLSKIAGALNTIATGRISGE